MAAFEKLTLHVDQINRPVTTCLVLVQSLKETQINPL